VPTYEYACTECGDRLEVVQRFSDDPLTVCEACGGRLRKVFSPVGIVFKGSGFYRTDSRNGNVPAGTANAKTEGSGDSAGSSDSTTAKTKTEPNGKPETKKATPADSGSSSSSATSSSGSSASKSGAVGAGSSGSGSKVA
jgi:putative FmdB family regulatory protein